MLNRLGRTLNHAYFRTVNDAFKHIDLKKDYYHCLGVQTYASDLVIKKSYIKHVKILHPDLNPQGHTKFTQVQEAYQVLSNPKSKDYYDLNCPLHAEKFQHWKGQKGFQSNNTKKRNEQFYEDLMSQNFKKAEKQEQRQRTSTNYGPRQKQETQEEIRERRKIDEEIELLRRNLMGRNSIWSRANCYMNYEERRRRELEKQRELQNLPGGRATVSFLRRFSNRHGHW